MPPPMTEDPGRRRGPLTFGTVGCGPRRPLILKIEKCCTCTIVLGALLPCGKCICITDLFSGVKSCGCREIGQREKPHLSDRQMPASSAGKTGGVMRKWRLRETRCCRR